MDIWRSELNLRWCLVGRLAVRTSQPVVEVGEWDIVAGVSPSDDVRPPVVADGVNASVYKSAHATPLTMLQRTTGQDMRDVRRPVL